ncbi:MAG: hypothetical protein ABI851_02935 [Saprospiraceae bacterium]
MLIMLFCNSHFFELKFVDLIAPILTIAALIIAYYQLVDIRKQKRIEFTYQLYRDFFNFINEERNCDIRKWIFGEEVKKIDRNKIGDLLEQFEAVWSLQNKRQIENDVVYDLFAFYIFKAEQAKNPSALEYIEQLRIDEKNLLEFSNQLFIGYESLLSQMKSKRSISEKAESDHLKSTKKKREQLN